jgi:hypothetical protein
VDKIFAILFLHVLFEFDPQHADPVNNEKHDQTRACLGGCHIGDLVEEVKYCVHANIIYNISEFVMIVLRNLNKTLSISRFSHKMIA